MPVYKQASRLLAIGVQTLMYTHKLCVKSQSRELFNCLNREFLNLLKLRTDHSGKFAPRVINPLYGNQHITIYIISTNINNVYPLAVKHLISSWNITLLHQQERYSDR